MIWPIIGFAVIFLLLAGFMAVVAFHVGRYRYSNDASIPVYGFLIISFLLIATLCFVEFRYTDTNTGTNNASLSTL